MIQRPGGRAAGSKIAVKNKTQFGRISVGRQAGQRRPQTPTQEGFSQIVGYGKSSKLTP